MSTIQSTSSTGSPQPIMNSQQATLGKDDFLKLLVTQLQHQDPLNPLKDAEFMAQMAQFSTLEQITNVAGSMERVAAGDKFSQAVSLIGRSVTYAREDGTTGQGQASGVEVEDGKILVTVGTDKVSPDTIRSVS